MVQAGNVLRNPDKFSTLNHIQMRNEVMVDISVEAIRKLVDGEDFFVRTYRTTSHFVFDPGKEIEDLLADIVGSLIAFVDHARDLFAKWTKALQFSIGVVFFVAEEIVATLTLSIIDRRFPKYITRADAYNVDGVIRTRNTIVTTVAPFVICVMSRPLRVVPYL